MESSDDSFAWTNTSNDNTDMSGDESESGKNYKKKLQKQLFREQQQHNNPSKKSKKRKLSENNQTEDEVTSAKRPHIKVESSSDQEVKKRKKKTKKNESETQPSQMILDDEESYQDVKVKRELDNSSSPRKSKKKKHKRRNSNESVNPDQQEPTSEQSNVQQCPELLSNGHDLQNDSYSDNNTSHSKVKRKKTRTPNTSMSGFEYNGMHIVDKFESEETLVESRNGPKVVHSHEQDTSFHRISENEPDVVCKQTKEDYDLDGSQIKETTPIKKRKPPPEPPARKLSGRLIFEDDLDESPIPIENQEESPVKLSSNLQKYMKVNSNLTPAHSSLLNNTIITEDDELWVLKLPANLKIKELVDTNINIDSKCKFKVDGEAYDGVKMDDTSFIAIASVDGDQQLKIKTYSVTESILIRKRIPKSYISNDILVQNESSYIPLPDTKCRHPLFGSNFKKAMKIPSAIREKLRAAPVEEVTTKERKKKKKLKRERTKSIVLEDEPPASKKRRVWDSEKAIEENLFNF